MDSFFVALGLVFVIEGIGVAAFPGAARRAADTMASTPDQMLRIVGLVSAVVGVVLIWVVRQLS